MKLATLTRLALLFTAGSIFAAEPYSPSGAGASPTASPSSSGSPTAILDDAKCEDIWAEAVGSSDFLSYDKAGQYITNLKLADPDNDNEISKTEFMDACKKGSVQRASTDNTIERSPTSMLPRKRSQQ